MPRRETYEEYTIDEKQLARIADSENPHAWIQSDFVVAIEDRSGPVLPGIHVLTLCLTQGVSLDSLGFEFDLRHFPI